MRVGSKRRGAEAYKECISNNPSRSGASKHEETADAPISGDTRHRKVRRADTPAPSPERHGDVHVGVASWQVDCHERKFGLVAC